MHDEPTRANAPALPRDPSEACDRDRPDAALERSLATRVASALVAAAVLWWSYELLDEWIAAGRFPRAYEWTSGWPLLMVVALGVGLVAGLARRTSAPALAASVCAAGLFPSIATELPHFSSNNYVYDGPFLMPLYAALIVGLVLYTAAGPRSHPDHQRVTLALLFACTANTKVFVRDGTGIDGLLLCWAFLAVVATPLPAGWFARLRADRFARLVAGTLVALVAWVALSVLVGDSLAVGTRAFQSVLLGAGLCYALAAGLGPKGVERAVGTLLLGIGACLGFVVLGAMDAAATEGWTRVMHTRLRLFQSHPNIIGPYFAGAAVLTSGLLLWRSRALGGNLVRSALLLLLLAGSLAALWRTESRASQLGLVVGLAVVVLVRFGPRVRRPAVGYAALAVGGLLGLFLFLTPLADPLRERLDRKAFEPASAIGQRYHYWRMSAATIRTSPLVGVGPAQNYYHARFAEPSYYDDAQQNHHPHNLLFYLAEGSGIPAVLLFLLAVVCLVELYRRFALPLPRGALGLPAALLGLPLGILASNMLDLGQVQPAYLPLYLWTGIGLGAALLWTSAQTPSAAAVRRTPGGVATGGLLVAVVPLGMLPLLSDALIQTARLEAFAQEEETPAAEFRKNLHAYHRMVLGRRIFFAHRDAGEFEPALLETIARSSRQTGLQPDFPLARVDQMILDVYLWLCDATPGNSRVWIDLARKSLATGRIEMAGDALDKALAYDPRGHRVGTVKLLRTWWLMARGREAEAREELFQAALRQGTTWGMVPNVVEDLRGRALPNAKRMVFQVRSVDETLVRIPLDDVLERLGAYALETARTDRVSARRYMKSLHGGYWRQNRPEDALPWFRAYRELVERPIPSIVKFEYEILNALGRREESSQLIENMYPDDRKVLEPDLLTGRMMEDETIVQRPGGVEQLDSFLVPLEQRDIFFEIAIHTHKLRAAAVLYATAGRWDSAVLCTRRFLREYIDVNERRRTTQTFVTNYLIPRGIPPLPLLDLLETVLPDHNVFERRSGGKSPFLDAVAQHLNTFWLPEDGDLVEVAQDRFGGTGPAGDGLVRRLRLLAGRGGR